MKIYINDIENYGAWDYFTDGDFFDTTTGEAQSFGETYVITGNDRLRSYREASWWTQAKDVYDDFNGYDKEDFLKVHPSFADDYEEIESIVLNSRDELEDIFLFIKKLNPNDQFELKNIHGSSQGDWNSVILKNAKDPEDAVNTLEQYYFGEVAEIWCEEENIMSYATSDEIWKAEQDGTLEDFVSNLLDLSGDEPLEIYKSDGYRTEINWVKVEDETEMEL